MPFRFPLAAVCCASACAFVCPPESLKNAPSDLKAGATCGGTCNMHGSCGAGLVCQQAESSQPLLLGVQAAGSCVKDRPDGELRFKEEAVARARSAVSEGVQLLNSQSNSLFMLVPVAVVKSQELPRQDGTTFHLSLQLAFSPCRNDGSHSVLDADCQPQEAEMRQTQSYDLTVREEHSQYSLLKAAQAQEHHTPQALTM
mmetsp:Transcript_16765/g.29391  ORF Transcript_16765/g.29391 Transcript_16765/m.29391 type:complete len:200 (-) Transcript_16765:36-635(-)